MALLDEMNSTIEKEGLAGEINRSFYRTGIDYLDYVNGKINTKTGEYELGVSGGKILLIPGWSGSGKTTTGIQIGWNIIAPEEDGMLLFFDAERGTSHERMSQIIGCDLDYYNENIRDKKVRLANVDVSSEDLQTLIDKIYRIKLISGAGLEFTKDGGLAQKSRTNSKNACELLPPTVIIVDSWAALWPSGINNQLDSMTSMDASARAKANNAVVDQVKGKLFKANIILIVINHIQKGITIDKYAADMRPLKYMKKDETLPGGGRVVYYADFVPRIEQKEKLTPDKEFGIKGFLQECIICKSRSNASGVVITMVFDQYTGVDNLLTNFLVLMNNGRIAGSGHGYSLKSYENAKFKRNNIKELYSSDRKFAKAWDAEVHDTLSEMIVSIEGKKITQVEPEYEGVSTPVPRGPAKKEEEVEITKASVKKMLRKELVELCESQEIDIDWKDYPGKEGLEEAKKDIINYLWS
jgi:RecA/RadA recombinase